MKVINSILLVVIFCGCTSKFKIKMQNELINLKEKLAEKAEKSIEKRLDRLEAKLNERIENVEEQITEKMKKAREEIIKKAKETLAESDDKIYEVQDWKITGDCLWKIAEKEYGDAWEWKKIWKANKRSIENPDLIEIGQKLIIPGR